MSRSSASASQNNLTLTQELERLEQSITLTLQEIDHNFSKAHRIVTTSILPLVEQYGENSKSVWEASKFWKQFFEASANVSLSGYEDLAGNEDGNTTHADNDETTAALDDTSAYVSQVADETVQLDDNEEDEGIDHAATPSRSTRGLHDLEESLLDDPTISGSTPRPPATKSMSMKPEFADLGSPYEKLRRELQSGSSSNNTSTSRHHNDNDTVRSELFDQENFDATPAGKQQRYQYPEDEDTLDLPTQQRRAATKLPDMTMTPNKHSSSILLEEPTLQFGGQQNTGRKDPLLHRVLDKNYRLQATPLTGKNAYRTRSPDKDRFTLPSAKRDRSAGRGGVAQTPQGKGHKEVWDESPMSSPEMAMPTLRSDLYSMSPVKTKGLLYNRGAGGEAAAPAPRTPGVSVQTPAAGRKTKDIFAGTSAAVTTIASSAAAGGASGKGKAKKDEITWESDSDDYDFGGEGGGFAGMSPPKTIQFALPPSKLMQTPAREASKRIVEDLFITAGADLGGDSPEYSPTMVKMNPDLLDDTF